MSEILDLAGRVAFVTGGGQGVGRQVALHLASHNAGGVAVSGLEQSQNALRISWSLDQVDEKLQEIMKKIHESCVAYGSDGNGYVNYVKGANIAGFVKVADAMLAYGIV